MPQYIIGRCPICQEELAATKLTCRHCGLELSNDFSLNKFSYLSETELAFLECFIKNSGNLKEVQKNLHLSYPSAKKKLIQVQKNLGFDILSEEKAEPEKILEELPIYNDESCLIKSIKEKLNAQRGIASVPLPKGGSFQIYYEEFGNGLYATNLPHNRILTWKAFDSALELLQKNKGRAIKGNAMKGKLGSTALPLNSLEGYIAFTAYGAKKGDSCLRTVSAVSAILEWSGLCQNRYGYVELASLPYDRPKTS